jgi:putative FmdB family regulatory protein
LAVPESEVLVPIYEYRCKKCKSRFELLQGMREKGKCPECGSGSVERLLSTFASLSPMSKCETATSACAPSKCGSGLCGMRR